MSATERRGRFNPWPAGLVAWYAGFIGLCVWFVIKSLGMNHDLVVGDYYAAGLRHDDKMRAIGRAKALENPPSIEIDTRGHRLIIRTPEIANGAVLTMYRPSDKSMDLKFALRDGGVGSVIPLSQLHPGKWQAQIAWATDGVDYYHREDLFLP